MRIKLPDFSNNFSGGGGTFLKNFIKSIKKFGHEIVGDGEYDVLFIAGATLCDRETFQHAKDNKKPIVLRVDNILEDGKNRNTGMSRLKEFAAGADVIIYQSEWAKRLLSPICGNGMVIYNGVDTDIFYPRKEAKNWENIRVFYSRWGRGEGKNFNVVQYFWRDYCLENKDDCLVIVGKFGDESLKVNHPFEFHNDETFEFHGTVQEQEKIADILRSCDVALLPYAFDACSNTILEAQACGLPVIYNSSGGTPEIITCGDPYDGERNPERLINKVLSHKINFEEFQEDWGLEKMAGKYHALFELLKQGQFDVEV